MRLTLRYLLAYLDEQLEPADAQEMSERIEASSFATDLMHRVRDVSRRLKLGAPKVTARGLAGDPNTVAEYLDHTMPPDQVTEFEKICLTSDVHLAEVASAHQILALVLGERAEVDPKLRRRMYAVPQLEQDAIEDQEVDEPIGVAPLLAAESALAEPRARRRPEIPDYLREKQPRQIPWTLLTLAASLLIVGGVVAYAFVAQPWTKVAVENRREGNSDATAKAPRRESADRDAMEAVAPVETHVAEQSAAQTSSEPPLPTDQITAEAESAATSAAPARRRESTPGAFVPDGAGQIAGADEVPTVPDYAARPDSTAPDSAALDSGAAGANSAPLNARGRPAMPESAPLRRPPANDSPFETDVPPPADDAVMPADDVPPTALTDRNLVPADERRGEVADAGPVAVGRLINDTEVLLRAGPAGSWQRLSTRDALMAEDELVALPTFRPGVALSTSGGAIAHLLGGSVVRLLPPDRDGIPGLHVIDGQIVVATVGKPGTQLNLQVDDRMYLVTFVGPDARIAVEARRWLPDGADPLEEPAKTSADLYVPNGQVEYRLASGDKTETATAPATRPLISRETADEAATYEVVLPPWINGNPLSQLEKMAADTVNKDLVADDATGESIQARLRELTQHRRQETRSLAVQCLTLIGDFESFLPQLNDEKQRATWSQQIDAVRRTMLRDPQMARQLQETLASQRDAKKAKELYDLLRGYSKRQLQEGAAALLVADLDHEDLDFRVLAFANLQRVAVGTLGYKPEFNAAKRQPGVRSWRQKLAEGQIVPKPGHEAR